MNLANKLTFIRIFLVVPFVVSLLLQTTASYIIALLLFVAAALTDFFDGLVARRRGEISDTGKFLDPLADKILISSALIIFLQIEKIGIPSWMVVIIIMREFIISGLRTYTASKGRIIATTEAGKVKTTSQILAVVLTLILLIVQRFEDIIFYVMLITVIITFYSGLRYIVDNRKYLTEMDKA